MPFAEFSYTLTPGGYGDFSPHFGLAVDNVLSMKVMLSNGTVATTSTCQHPDLFFALRGGGPGTKTSAPHTQHSVASLSSRQDILLWIFATLSLQDLPCFCR